jgi:hypothetical protein
MTLIVHSIISSIYLDGNGGGVGRFEGDLFISGHLEKVKNRLSDSYEVDDDAENSNTEEGIVSPIGNQIKETVEESESKSVSHHHDPGRNAFILQK